MFGPAGGMLDPRGFAAENPVEQHNREQRSVMEQISADFQYHSLVTSRHGVEHLSAPPPFSIHTPNARYKKIYIDELEQKTHFGRYLVVRAIVDPFKVVALHTVLEDERSTVLRGCLYNFISPLLMHNDVSWALPLGQKLVILEPCMKVAVSGCIVIRCDNPSHIVLLHEYYTFTKELKWRNGPTMLRRKTGSLKLAESHKEHGNVHFKGSRFSQAAASYSEAYTFLQAISSDPSAAELTVKVLSNRSEALLKLGQNHMALRDANLALHINGNHGKSFLRRVRAMIGLRLFQDALMAVYCGLNDFPSGNVHDELVNFSSQLEFLLQPPSSITEEDISRLLNFSLLEKDGEVHGAVRVLWPDYSKPLQVKRSRFAQGRGTFAAAPIRQGEVVLVEKAMAMVCPSDVTRIVEQWSRNPAFVGSFNFDSTSEAEKMLTAERVELTYRVTMLACRRFSSLKEVTELAGLPTGEDRAEASPGASLSNIPPPNPVSIEMIEKVCSRNTLRPDNVQTIKNSLCEPTSSHTKEKKVAGEDRNWSPTPVKGIGLWRKAGLINHRCSPSCSVVLIGDMLLLTALRDIARDEELSINYVPISDSYVQRQATVKDFDFKCVCKRCRREEAHKVKYERTVKTFFLLEEEFAGKKNHPAALLESAIQLRKKVAVITPSRKESLLLASVNDLILQIQVCRRDAGEVIKAALAVEEPLSCVEHNNHLLPVFQVVWHVVHACSALSAAAAAMSNNPEAKENLQSHAKELARRGLQLALLLLGSSHAVVEHVFGKEVLKRLQTAGSDDA